MTKKWLLPVLLTLIAYGFSEGSAWAQFGGSSSSGGGSSSGFRPSSGSRSLGRGTSSRSGAFGSNGMTQQMGPLPSSSGQFNSNAFNSQNSFGGRGNNANRQLGGMGGNMGNNANRTVRLNAYAFQVPSLPADPEDILPRLESILDGGTVSATHKRNIRLKLEENTLVMSGTVANAREKQLAEAMVRLEPGVYDVRNDLVVKK